MTNVRCSVSSCSYYKSNKCFAEVVNIGGKGACDECSTCCGSFLNKALYSNLAEFTSMRGQTAEVTCSANTCTYNENGYCALDSIDVGGDANANIYTETNCQSFEKK